jgi:hypothetical protein
MSEEPPPYIVKLKKRESPSDYMDGFMAGLQSVRDAIDKSIANYQEIRAVTEAALRKGPTKPED